MDFYYKSQLPTKNCFWFKDNSFICGLCKCYSCKTVKQADYHTKICYKRLEDGLCLECAYPIPENVDFLKKYHLCFACYNSRDFAKNYNINKVNKFSYN